MTDLNLTESHFVKVRGELTMYGSWYGDRLRPCLAIVPTFRNDKTPLLVELDSAYRWNPDDKDVDPRGCAALVMQFLHENGLDSGDILHAHMRVMSFIHDHLGDLLTMPPKPTNLVVVADAFRTDHETGKTTHQEIVKRV